MNSSTKNMMDMLRMISPLQRMIASPGLDKTFEILKREIPGLKVHSYPTGMQCEDWEVPFAWEVEYGAMKDEKGRIIASTEESMLFVAAYSQPVNGWFTKKEIEKHLRTRPDMPESFALEHRYAYNYKLKDWGISLPCNRWKKLSPGKKYHIEIKVKTSKGAMKVGEWILPGRKKDIVCFNAHIDELCNDDLSGCVLAVEIMRHISRLKGRKYTYQMILSPEMIGTFFHVLNNMKTVSETIGMLNLEMTGAGKEWCLKKALTPDSMVEAALQESLLSRNIPFRKLSFFEGYGNDEKVYEWPSLRKPSVALQRYPFKEYHTSSDTVDIIKPGLMAEALEICTGFVDILEHDYVPAFKSIMPPWLTKHDLYFDRELDPENYIKYNSELLFNIDGSNSLLDLSELTGIRFQNIHDYLEKFVKKGFILKK